MQTPTWISRIGVTATLAVTVILSAPSGQAQQPEPPSPDQGKFEYLTIDGAKLDWIEDSDVASRRDGILDSIEFDVGDVIEPGTLIGVLNFEMAEMNLKKAEIAMKARGALERAKAQVSVAEAEYRRIIDQERLFSRTGGSVSQSEKDQALAAVKVARAQEIEAMDQIALAEAEYNIAMQIRREHEVRAPIGGVILERRKNPGEGVQTNEPVVRIGRLNRVRVFAKIPLQDSIKVREGMRVVVRPDIPDARLPVEQMDFYGKVTFVDPDVQPGLDELTVRIRAEVENRLDQPGPNGEFLLKVRYPVEMTIEIPVEENQGGIAASQPTLDRSR